MENPLTQIHEDMPVYDREGQKIGTVKSIQFGDEDLGRPGAETNTAQKPKQPGNNLLEDFAEALTFEDRIPAEVQKRLQRYGFIKIDTGVLTSTRYASADQIAKVAADRVDLKTTLDELVAA